MNKNLFLFLTFSFLVSTPVWALRPIVHYHDLIAGEPDAGYRDGSFESAQFNGPQGLAFNEDGTRLFVADQNNNCIRVIFRDQNNRVETLTGSPKVGDANGSLQDATFNAPRALAYIGKNRLVVYDSGNHRLRLIDFNQRQVSDLAGNGKQGETDGKAMQASLGEVWNILFLDNSIYFSEPHSGRLRKLDLTTGLVSTVLLNNPQIPNPGSLCLYQNALCVTDWQTSDAFRVDFKSQYFQPIGNFDVSDKKHATVLAAASSGKYLYGFRQGLRNSWVRLPDNQRIQLFSVWSNEISPDKFLDFPEEEAVAFIPDPREEMKFFLTSASLSYVMSLKDYNFSVQDPGKLNPQKLNDFEYPVQKPAHTYRILVVGNSLSYSFGGGDYARSTFRRSLNFPKQLELLLNTRAAVENAPLNYEVLDIGHGEGEMNLSSYFWPRYEVPDLVKKFDIDLVLYIVSTFRTDSYSAYFQQPLTKEGIPAEKLDSEYMLEPWDQKIPSGVPRDFFEKCMDHQWVKPATNTQLKFEDTDKTLTDPAVRADVVELLSRPIKGLSDQLKSMKTSANQPVRCQMLLIYRGDTRGSLELYRDFWRRMAQKDGFPLLDMVGDFLALKPTYENMFSYTDFHYNADGMRLYAYLVSQELISHHLIPFN